MTEPVSALAVPKEWQEFARSLGVLPESVVVPWVIVTIAAGTVVVAR